MCTEFRHYCISQLSLLFTVLTKELETMLLESSNFINKIFSVFVCITSFLNSGQYPQHQEILL